MSYSLMSKSIFQHFQIRSETSWMGKKTKPKNKRKSKAKASAETRASANAENSQVPESRPTDSQIASEETNEEDKQDATIEVQVHAEVCEPSGDPGETFSEAAASIDVSQTKGGGDEVKIDLRTPSLESDLEQNDEHKQKVQDNSDSARKAEVVEPLLEKGESDVVLQESKQNTIEDTAQDTSQDETQGVIQNKCQTIIQNESLSQKDDQSMTQDTSQATGPNDSSHNTQGKIQDPAQDSAQDSSLVTLQYTTLGTTNNTRLDAVQSIIPESAPIIEAVTDQDDSTNQIEKATLDGTNQTVHTTIESINESQSRVSESDNVKAHKISDINTTSSVEKTDNEKQSEDSEESSVAKFEVGSPAFKLDTTESTGVDKYNSDNANEDNLSQVPTKPENEETKPSESSGGYSTVSTESNTAEKDENIEIKPSDNNDVAEPKTLAKKESSPFPSDVIVPDGPFSVQNLLKDIKISNPDIPESANSHVTCVAAYEENLYIGTSHGEILHYYHLETDYTLITRVRVHATKTRPVHKILLLPKINKALVLNGSMINVLLLPELSPANIGKIKDVNDLSVDIDNIDTETTEVPVVLFTKKMIRIINVTNDSLKLIKDINYPNTLKGLRRSNLALVATSTNYDLIDINSFQKIPLLPISNLPPEECDLEPYVLPIAEKEYLVSCGSKTGEPAMGMILNDNGDISRGTIPWKDYPHCLSASYPYVLSGFDNKVCIHSILEQHFVQEIHFPGVVRVMNVLKVFEEPYEGLSSFVEKCDLLETHVIKTPYSHLCMISSNLLVFQKDGGRMDILKQNPEIFRLKSLMDVGSTFLIEEEYESVANNNKRSKLIDEFKFEFLKETLGLIYLKEAKFHESTSIWIGNEGQSVDELFARLNPKILIYMLHKLITFKEDDINKIFDSLISIGHVYVFTYSKQIFSDIMANPNFGFLTSTIINILMNWLSSFKNLVFSKSSEEPGTGKEGPFFEPIDDAKLASIPNEMVSILEQIETVLLKFYIYDSIKVEKDKYLLLFLKKHVIVGKENCLNLLKQLKKFDILLTYFQSVDDTPNIVKTWRAIVEENLSGKVDEISKLNSLVFDNNQIDQALKTDQLKWLLKIDQTANFETLIIDNKCGDLDSEMVLSLIEGSSKNEIEKLKLKIVYLSQKTGTKTIDDQLFGLFFEYLQKCTATVTQFINGFIGDYKNAKEIENKPGFDKYLKFELRTLHRHDPIKEQLPIVTDFVSRLMDTVMTDHNKVNMEKARNYFKETKMEFFTILLDYKLENFDSVFDALVELTDYRTIENFILSRYTHLYGYKKDILSEISRNLSDDMKRLYEKYLEKQPSNYELHRHFFNNYGEMIDLEDFMNSKSSENLSIKLLSERMLMKKIIMLDTQYSISLKKKIFARNELLFYERLLKQLKPTQ